MEKENKINCHLCKGKAILKNRNISLDDGKILIKDSPYYECLKCGEQFVTNEQMSGFSNKIKCVFCGGKAVLGQEDLKLNDEKKVIKDTPCYFCKNCKESFSTSEQMDEIEKRM